MNISVELMECFYEKFECEYESLYELYGECEVREAVTEFDKVYGIDEDFAGFVTEFHEYREYKTGSFEMISSDREAAAFMLAYKKVIKKEQ